MCTSEDQKIKADVLALQDNYSDDTKLFCRWLEEQGKPFNDDSLSNWVKELAEQGKAAATINRRISAIKSRFKYLFDKYDDDSFNILAQFTAEKNLKKIKSVKVNSKAVDPSKVLTREETRVLIKNASSRIGLIIEYLFYTGCRVSEATGSLQSCVKRRRDIVQIRIIGKGGKERFVEIPLNLYRRIDSCFKGEKYIFETVEGNRYKRTYIYHQLSSLGHRTLGKNVTPHFFRHTLATITIEETGKIKAISKYLGHSSVSTTMDMYTQEEITFKERPSL